MPTYEYARPALTVDVAVFRGEPGAREVLLIERASEPFAHSWALPGGFVDEGETLDAAARRELAEETGLELTGDLDQVGAYGDPGRDPRGWTVSVAFAATLSWDEPSLVRGGSDAAEAAWHPVGSLPHLAFDHDIIVADAMRQASFGG